MKNASISRSPRNVQYLRRSNRGAILRVLAARGQATRVELAEALGLTKMAISAIVTELLAEGLVREQGAGEAQQNIGRRPMSLSIAPRRVNALGILVTRHALKCLVMDLNGERIDQSEQPIEEGTTMGQFERMMIQQAREMLRAHAVLSFAGIGVSCIGPLDIQEQKLLYPPNFRGLGGIWIGRLLRREFHLPVFMDNDMNTCALAEQCYGLGRGVANLIYVGFGSGVGAGMIVNGAMLHGGSGFAGELGHVSADLNGPLCFCGQKGCLETYTSTGALLGTSGCGSIEELRAQARQSPMPPGAGRAVSEYMRAIHSALVTVANLFDPDLVVIGDAHGLIGPEQIQQLESALSEHMFQHGFREIHVAPGTFGQDNALIGGAALVFQEIFRGRLNV